MKYMVSLLAILAVVIAMNVAVYKVRHDACMDKINDFYYCIVRP